MSDEITPQIGKTYIIDTLTKIADKPIDENNTKSEEFTESFLIKIIDEESEFFDWTFKINRLGFPEWDKDDLDDYRLEIDYDVILAEDQTLPDIYESSEDQRIVDYLGSIILDFIALAVKESKLVIKNLDEKEELKETIGRR